MTLVAKFFRTSRLVMKLDSKVRINMLGSSHAIMEAMKSKVVEDTCYCFGAKMLDYVIAYL